MKIFSAGYDKLYVSVIRLRSADFDKDVKITTKMCRSITTRTGGAENDEKRKVEFVQLS